MGSFNYSRATNQNFMKSQRAPAGMTACQANIMRKQQPKTTSYMGHYKKPNKNAKFWGDLKLLAEKQGKIETIDSRLNPNEYRGPATSITTQSKYPRDSSLNVRGQGGIHKAMNGVKQREVRGEEGHEPVLEGRSMAAILMPDALPQKRCRTPVVNNF